MSSQSPPTTGSGPLHGLPLLRAAFAGAVDAADPAQALAPYLPPPAGRLLLVAVGKAAAPMAARAWREYAGGASHAALEGIVISPHGDGPSLELAGLTHLRAAHPVPDQAGVDATQRVLQLVQGARPDDLLLVLLSGGGSALLTAPAGVTLAQKAELTRVLLASGASITQINTVRKHLSAVKGGRLAALSRAPSLTLAVSDVTGDDPATIASGPTSADPTTFAQALRVVRRFAPGLPEVLAALQRGAAGSVPESPKPGDPRLAATRYQLVADAAGSLAAVRRLLDAHGYAVTDLGPGVAGEARQVGAQHAQLLRRLAQRGGAERLALLSGGELTVTLGAGRPGVGGPNGEYALAAARGLLGAPLPGWRPYLLAADSDGIDGAGGSAAAAGALLGPRELSALTQAALDAALAGHGSHELLGQVGGLLVTGPTRTNVNDVRVLLLESVPRQARTMRAPFTG